FLVFFFLGGLASQALAFNMTVGKDKLDVSQILNIPDSPVKTACATNCSDTASKITNCANDPACLCAIETVTSLLGCESCMLNYLIKVNKPAPVPLAGSNVLMGAYAAACKEQAKVVLPANLTALTLPSTWDGPLVAVLPVGTAAIYAFFGGLFGISALYILSTLE
ncbi:hypothetical protein CPB83DRAFT_730080, partial [Crepidotus variabilis]